MSGIFGSDPADLKITVAMLSDSLDTLGLRNQVLESRLTGIKPGQRAIGLARTAQFSPSTEVDPARPYDDAIDFIDSTKSGELIVVATDESNHSAFWGELFSAAAIGRESVGMITDGNVRDVDKIVALRFPVFARSHRPIDFKGRMRLETSQQPVVIGGVSISPGDLVAADDDGCVVVPSQKVPEVLAVARKRATAESTVLTELLDGSTLREVWTKHGVL
jgi:regulator of RNase E activity RraA